MYYDHCMHHTMKIWACIERIVGVGILIEASVRLYSAFAKSRSKMSDFSSCLLAADTEHLSQREKR